jgi:hypothetical protein
MSGCVGYKNGEFYDTISPGTGSWCVIRVRTTDLSGRAVVQCQNFVHQDGGAMVWMSMAGGPSSGALTKPPVSSYSCLSPLPWETASPSASPTVSPSPSPSVSPIVQPVQVSLTWTVYSDPDGLYDFSSSLEFCVINAGSSLYGYRLSSGDACLSPGPIVRMSPGYRYFLTLKNGAPTGTVPTNIRVHGLHVLNDGNSNDGTR